MGEAYPELRRDAARDRGAEAGGGALLPDHRQRHGDPGRDAGRRHPQVDGDTAFKLHDTFGFPLDLTADVCRERGVTVDEAGFNTAMNRQREQARASAKFKMAAGLAYSGDDTAFHGYEHLVCEHSKVTAIYVEGTRGDPGQGRRRRGDRARPHAVLCRERRPGRRHRRAAQRRARA
jgi:alanyl-tRNA synthetase